MTEPKTIGYALLVDLDYADAPLENGVYCFVTEEEAIDFAIESLVAYGEILRDPDATLWCRKREQQYVSKQEALEDWIDGLDTFNYYHIREVKRLPTPITRTKKMPIQNCPIDIPEGWEFVRYGVPDGGETFLDEGGKPDSREVGCVAPWVIIRRARPKIEVGDWVRLNRVGSTFHSTCGTVKQTNADGDFRVEFGSRGGGWFAGDLLIKQTRTVKPYTIDQCITEIAKRGGRAVIRGGEPTEIVTVYSNGVSTDKPHVGFVSYGAAVKVITWPNGDAFGVVTWEDAE